MAQIGQTFVRKRPLNSLSFLLRGQGGETRGGAQPETAHANASELDLGVDYNRYLQEVVQVRQFDKPTTYYLRSKMM